MFKQTVLQVIQLHRRSAATTVVWNPGTSTKHWQIVITRDVLQQKQYIIMLFAILRLGIFNWFLYLISESQLCTASLYITKWKDFDKFYLAGTTECRELSWNEEIWLLFGIILALTWITHRAFERYMKTRFKNDCMPGCYSHEGSKANPAFSCLEHNQDPNVKCLHTVATCLSHLRKL